MKHIITDKREPAGAAIPMGNRVSGYRAEAKYAPGILTRIMARKLCRKDMPDLPEAQKYPLKQK